MRSMNTGLINLWVDSQRVPHEECGYEMGADTLPLSPWCFESISPYTGDLRVTFPAARKSTRGGILADEMGLGKTVMLASLIHANSPGPDDDESLDAGPASERVSPVAAVPRFASLPRGQATLVVAPLSLLGQWKEELERASQPGTLNVELYYGSQRGDLGHRLANKQVDVVVTSYGTLASQWNLISEPLEMLHKAQEDRAKSFLARKVQRISPLLGVQWHRVVLDEAHTIRNRSTKMSRAACALQARLRWCLTGTPIVNRLTDLFQLLCFLRVEPWGHWPFFHALVAKPFVAKNPAALDIVAAILSSTLLRREKRMRDAAGVPIVALPPKTYDIQELDFSPEEREIYNNVYAQAKRRYDSLVRQRMINKNYSLIFAVLMRLRQAVCHPLLVPHYDPDAQMVAARSSGTNSTVSVGVPLDHDEAEEEAKANALIYDLVQRFSSDSHRSTFAQRVLEDLTRNQKSVGEHQDQEVHEVQENGNVPAVSENENQSRAMPSDLQPKPEAESEATLELQAGPKEEGNFSSDSYPTTTIAHIKPAPKEEEDPRETSKPREVTEPLKPLSPTKKESSALTEATESTEDAKASEALNSLELECQLCLEEVTDRAYLPQCLHSACYDCLVRVIQAEEVRGHKAFCPMCRAGPIGVDNLVRVPTGVSDSDAPPPDALAAKESVSEGALGSMGSADSTKPVAPTDRPAQAGTEAQQAWTRVFSASRRLARPHAGDDSSGGLSHPLAGVRESTKCATLVSSLRELREKEPDFKAVIFSQFTSFLDLVQEILARAGFPAFRIDGKTSQAARAQAVSAFQQPISPASEGIIATRPRALPTDGDSGRLDSDLPTSLEAAALDRAPQRTKQTRTDPPRVLLASTRAAGVGLNLTAANHVWLLDCWWNSSVEEQAVDRVHRIGQTRPVVVHRILIRDSIEQRILLIQQRKQALVNNALGKEGADLEENLKLLFSD